MMEHRAHDLRKTRLGRVELAAFAVDRDLPVALGTQLRGLVAFGIGLGRLRPGDRLPSVRELAEHLGLSPMTVAQVYAEMTRSGLLTSRRGNGTFVAGIAPVPAIAAPPPDTDLHRAIDGVITEARALGLAPGDLVGLIAARLASNDLASNDLGPMRPRVVLVGHFAGTTAAYCEAVRTVIGDRLAIEPATLADLRDSPATRNRAAGADLVLTLPHRRAEVGALLPRTDVAALTFIPSSETRQRLAVLDPGARVAIVSVFPEFAPVMKAEVQRFAPHLVRPAVILYDAPDRDRRLEAADVIVFATGADDLGLPRPPGVPAFEFRHTPDPACVRRLLLPLLGGQPNASLLEVS